MFLVFFLSTFRCYPIHDWVTWSAHTQRLISLLQAYLPPASNLPTVDCVPACVVLVCRTQLTAPTVRQAHKPRGCSAVLPPPPPPPPRTRKHRHSAGIKETLAQKTKFINTVLLHVWGQSWNTTESWPWRRKFSCCVSSPQTFSVESAALTTELSLPPCVQSSVTAWSLGHVRTVGSGCRALMISVVDVDFLNCRSLWDQSSWGIRKEILGSCFLFCPVIMKRLMVQELDNL